MEQTRVKTSAFSTQMSGFSTLLLVIFFLLLLSRAVALSSHLLCFLDVNVSELQCIFGKQLAC